MQYIIQPYTYFVLKNDSALFYNTITGSLFESSETDFIKILRENDSISTRKFQIKGDEKKFKDLLDSLNSDYAIFKDEKEKNPAIWNPILNIQERPEKILNHLNQFDGIGILRYLSQLTFFINQISPNLKGAHAYYQNQTIFPSVSAQNHSLSVEFIIDAIDRAKPYLSIINIVIGSFFDYPKIHVLVDFLSQLSIETYFYLYSDFIKDLPKNNFKNIILINKPISEVEFNQIINNPNNLHLRFLVSSEKELDYYNRLLKKTEFNDFSFVPIFYENMAFIENNLKFTKDDMLYDRISFSQIFINQTINQRCFGDMFVYPDGGVKTSLSGPIIGNIKYENLDKMIFEEINNQRDWFLTRRKFPSCTECIYNSFCPSVSEYERILNKPFCFKS